MEEEAREGEGSGLEAVDWLGRPATEKHGGVTPAALICVNQGLWNVSNYAIIINLVLYFNQVLQMSPATSANNVTNWLGTMWILSLLGGFMGDAYWGRFWTCVIFQLIHMLGLILLGLSTTIHSLKPPECNDNITINSMGLNCTKPSHTSISIFMIAIYIVALGMAGHLPAFIALGGDQFDLKENKTSFFGWLFFFTNSGSIVVSTLFVYIQKQGKWALGYWLSAIVGLLALFIFTLGVPKFKQCRPSGNPLTRMMQVVVATIRKWSVQPPNNASQLYEVPLKELEQQGREKLPHTPTLRFLDKAATYVEKENAMVDEEATKEEKGVSPWKQCSVTQVEEMKKMCRVLPVILCLVPIGIMATQIGTFFVEQAAIMDRRVGSLTIPIAGMSTVNVISIFMTTLFYPKAIVPIARKLTGQREGLQPLQRIVIGELLAVLAIIVSALIESKRLHSFSHDGHLLSVLWLAPQQALMGISFVFGSVGAMDFLYSESPSSMRALVSSFSLALNALGNFGSTLLVSLIVHFTTSDGHLGWIPSNLNDGHLDYFYWLLAILGFFATFLLIAYSWWFIHTSIPQKMLTNGM